MPSEEAAKDPEDPSTSDRKTTLRVDQLRNTVGSRSRWNTKVMTNRVSISLARIPRIKAYRLLGRAHTTELPSCSMPWFFYQCIVTQYLAQVLAAENYLQAS